MHLFHYEDRGMVEIRKASINDLEDEIKKRHVLRELWLAMREGLVRYFRGKPPESCVPSTERSRRAYAQQSQIGWDHFLKGRVTLTWGQEISEHYTTATGLGYIESQRCSLLILISHL